MLADRIAARASEAVRSADPVSMEEFSHLLGASNGNAYRSKAGTSVGPRRALGLPSWYSGVRYLSETVSSLPVHRYADVGDTRMRRADPPWVTKPDTELPWLQWAELQMMALLHKGNGYSFKLRNTAGQVIGLREIHPDRVTVGVAPDGTKRFLVDKDEYVYTVREILHIPGLGYDGRCGMNPIQYQADSLGAIAAADDYAGRFFGAGTHLGGIISIAQPLTNEQREQARDEWDAFHQGLVNAHRTAILSNGSTYNRISLDAESSQLLESRQFGVTDVARILRIPPHKLYDLTRATFSNIEHQSIEAVVDSIRPWVERLEAHINFDPDLTPPGTFIEFQLEGLLRGDSSARGAFYNQLIQAGMMSPQTGARLENLPAPEELNYYLRPLNSAVIRPGEDEQPPALPVKVDMVGQLIRAGFKPEAALAALGLPSIPHTGFSPVTVTDNNAPASVPPAGGPSA